MNEKDRVLEMLKERRERILNGKINSIPCPFERFSEDFLGIEQGKYYVITGGTKSSKTQLGSFLFIYTPLLYAFKHPDKLRLKIFYYNLEESKDDILIRFMCHLLYIRNNIRVSPTELKSSNSKKLLSADIFRILESEEYKQIIDFFEKTIIFGDSANPTGINKEVISYVNSHGKTHYKSYMKEEKDENGLSLGSVEHKCFDYYIPDDPDEYRILFIDHVSLLSTERDYTLKKTIDKLSEYCVLLRNRYGIIPVVIQQQSLEQEGLDAVKANRIRPSLSNLSDSKYTCRDANVVLGIFSPYRFEIPDYKGYDIRVLKDNIRFLELIINRGGSPGGIIALYFDGAVNYFRELPKANDKESLEKIYRHLRNKMVSLIAVCKNFKHYIFNKR